MKYIIYSIHKIGTEENYIGSTIKLQIRRNGHRFALNNSRHHNAPLQQDWTELGELAFEFIQIDELEGEEADVKKREAEWIAKCGTYNQMVANADGTGMTMNDRLRKNMGKHLKRRHEEGDPTIKAGLQKALAVSHANASERVKRLWRDADYAARQTAVITEKWQDPEFRESMARGQAERWAKPEEHERQSQAILKAWKSRTRENGLPRGVTRAASKIERYAASIWYDGKSHHLGVFDTIDEASAARKRELDQRSTTMT